MGKGVLQAEFVKPRRRSRVEGSWIRPVQILKQRGPKMSKRDLQPERMDSRQLTKHKREYAQKRRRQTLSLVPIGMLGVLVAMGGGGMLGLSDRAFLMAVGGVILSFFGFSLLNWRCPSCDAYLGQRLNPRECKACGAILRGQDSGASARETDSRPE